jgi:four helix bundle protein
MVCRRRSGHRPTEKFPRSEAFGLTSQLRRAAVSIPSNIAEGYGRGSARQFIYFLKAARGSLAEVETQLVIAGRLNYLEDPSALQERIVQCYRLLHGLIRSVQKKL